MRILILISFFCLQFSVHAQTFVLSGKITDSKNNALPFASVFVKGTTIGTNTNADGQYTLRLKPGNYEIVFQYVGFKKEIKPVNLTADYLLNVTLQSDNYQLKEVQITAGEDPAYAVIRQAIKKRKFYLNQVDKYTCRAYIKGLQRLNSIPKNLGKLLKITMGENPIDSTLLGVIYLSESESKYYYDKPDEKEVMFSSRVSGNKQAFSFNQLREMKFNFYENLITIDGLSDRPLISPINENAFLSYRYKLLGTTFEDGRMINKIEVLPKRKTDPCFHGIIYIAENSWRIHSLDMYLTKDAKINFVDTLEIRQLHAPLINDSIWMPVAFNFGFKFKFLGFVGNGYYNAVVSDYDLNPEFPKKFFKNELLKVEDEANKKDSLYWKTNRPIPLTTEEVDDYRKKDSLSKITDSKHYKDSVDKKFNKLKIQSLILGYNYRNSYKKINFSTTGLLTSGVQYNTVEGMNASMNFTFSKEYENYRNHSISASIRHGFSNYLSGAKLGWSYLQNPKRFQQFAVYAQSMVNQYNNSNPISESMNTIYSLYLNDNFMKLYKKTSLQVYFRRELVNGLYFYGSVEYAERAPLKNSTDLLITDNPNKLFTSNDPLHFTTDDSLFKINNSLVVDVMFRIRFKQKYYTVPHRKIISGSKYPRFNIGYKKAIPLKAGDADYDLAALQMDDNVSLGLLGTFSYRAMAGYFLRNQTMYFMDYKHFNGNQTVLANRNYLGSFKLLPYYKYSTEFWYAEAHAEHHFNGFIFNKIPLLKKARIQEVVGGHILYNDKLDQYYEINFGIEKILQIIRFDYVLSYGPYGKFNQGFLIGIDAEF
ncbi:MAG: carboxypeptidase-like regulatory domain-containing protein [Bacteroidia bacterium]|nr:carboxypeptidase-like regulatory domain-containing protein [Bacteroidia bacterium]